MVWKRIYAAWFGIHFFLITAVCLAGIFSLIAEGSTILPSKLDTYARKAEIRAAWLLEKRRDRRVRSSRLSPPQIDLRTLLRGQARRIRGAACAQQSRCAASGQLVG
jgi:hypothetical protein